jgi:2-polyprenyl-3-methyl-5-hydroxy-6-metoxy-1,4-benzoquinol methylase
MKLDRHEEIPDLREHWSRLFALADGRVQHRFGYVEPYQFDRLNAIVDWVATLHPGRVLEVGCLEGMMTERLAQVAESVVAVDFIPGFMDTAVSLPNVRYELHDVEEWTPTLHFDVVVMSEVLEHLRDPMGALRRLTSKSWRVIASSPINEELTDRTWSTDIDTSVPNPFAGKAIGETAGHVWAMDLAGFTSWFEAAGLTIERTEIHFPSAFVQARR